MELSNKNLEQTVINITNPNVALNLKEVSIVTQSVHHVGLDQ